MSKYVEILMNHLRESASPYDNDPTDAEIAAWYDEVEARLPHDFYKSHGGDIALDDFEGAEGKISRKQLRSSLQHWMEKAVEQASDLEFTHTGSLVADWMPKIEAELKQDGWSFED
jgi:hypothetical protein